HRKFELQQTEPRHVFPRHGLVTRAGSIRRASASRSRAVANRACAAAPTSRGALARYVTARRRSAAERFAIRSGRDACEQPALHNLLIGSVSGATPAAPLVVELPAHLGQLRFQLEDAADALDVDALVGQHGDAAELIQVGVAVAAVAAVG